MKARSFCFLINRVKASFSGQENDLMSFDLGLLKMMFYYLEWTTATHNARTFTNTEKLRNNFFIITSQYPIIKDDSTLFTPGDQC